MLIPRGIWRATIKLALLVATLVLIVQFGIVSPTVVAATFARPGTAAVAFVLIVLGANLNVLRWHLLLNWQGAAPRFSQVWQISYIAFFLGSFLPGAAGGDAMRAIYLHREFPRERVPALLTILFDRALGFAALLLLVIGLAATIPSKVSNTPILASLVSIAALALLALAAAPFLLRVLTKLLRRLSIQRPAHVSERLLVTIGFWRGRIWRVVFCLGAGVLGHALLAAAIVILARSIGAHDLSIRELSFAGAFATLANQIPVTPGGLGVGESSFSGICRLLAPDAGTASLGSVIFVMRLLTLLSFLPGAFALLVFRPSAAQAEVSNAASIPESTVSTPTSSSAG